MAKKLYERFESDQVTDSMMQEASTLFSENYGVWDKKAANATGAFAKEGSRVKMNKDRLRAQSLPKGVPSSYVRVTVDACFAGNAFASRWMYNDKCVCWVTQVVVHRDYREQGLELGLLNELRGQDDDIYGVISSHIVTCLATATAFGNAFKPVQLSYIKDHAEAIMKISPIGYVKNAKLRGSLFNLEDTSGIVSSVDTNFFINHVEQLEALAWVQENMDWPLGDLTDGFEFLLILEARRCARSTSRPRSSS